MASTMKVQEQRARRVHRVRSKLNGTSEKPRLTVKISNQHVLAQLIDDVNGKTIAASDSYKSKAKSLGDKALEVGKDIATKAKKIKVEEAIFDRGSKQYHGRIKALADSAREAGLKV